MNAASNFNALQRPKTEPSLYANAPLDILAGGSFRWPNTTALDNETTQEAIRRLELGDFARSLTDAEFIEARQKRRGSGR